MKIIHIAALGSATGNIGVVKQMEYELIVSRSLDSSWDVELWTPDVLPGYNCLRQYPKNIRGWLSRKLFMFKRLRELAEMYDVIMVRYSPLDFLFPLFVTSKAKLISVHHTLEVEAIKSSPFLGANILAIFEKVLGLFVFWRTDGVIGVTQQIVDYERGRSLIFPSATYVYPNGVLTHVLDSYTDEREGSIKLLFVASTFFEWHGLSQLLHSLHLYKLNENVELHLVGNLLKADLDFIKNHPDLNIIQHGYLNESEIYALASRIDVALASFSLGSTGMVEACTLKVREYLSLGLPIYSGHIDSGLSADYPYYRVGALKLEDIVSYANLMRSVSRDVIAKSSFEYIDKELLFKGLRSWINDTFKNSKGL